jgi:hypothetical protein
MNAQEASRPSTTALDGRGGGEKRAKKDDVAPRRDVPPSRASTAASVTKEAQDALLRKLESLSKDEQLVVLRTALERRLGDRGQVCCHRPWRLSRRVRFNHFSFDGHGAPPRQPCEEHSNTDLVPSHHHPSRSIQRTPSGTPFLRPVQSPCPNQPPPSSSSPLPGCRDYYRDCYDTA